jgi:adenosine deaminase
VARKLPNLRQTVRPRLVGIDLAGDEINYPAERFAPVFQWAKGQGLHITIHAAEAGQASNIHEAIQLLGADRIGHGVRAWEDASVMDELIKTQVALEMCPTSNLHTGVITNLAHHPLSTYQKLGIRVTINTDDPSISNTSLTDEYLVAARGMESSCNPDDRDSPGPPFCRQSARRGRRFRQPSGPNGDRPRIRRLASQRKAATSTRMDPLF